MITIWSCTHHTHLFRPTCLIINTCDQNWRVNARPPLAYREIFPMDFPTLPYALIFSITGIAVEVLMVANDRGTECCCCCWIVVNLWIVVAGFGSSWVVVGSLWGCCGVIVGHCGLFHVLVTTLNIYVPTKYSLNSVISTWCTLKSILCSHCYKCCS